MEYEKWMESVTADDMPNDDLKFIAKNAGLKAAMTLILLLPGLCVNIPKNALRRLKEKYIIKEYDGTRFTLNRLVVECSLSQRHIYKIIKKHLNLPPPKD